MSSFEVYDGDGTTAPAPATADMSIQGYIRPVMEEGMFGYGVYSADGKQLAVFATAQSAFFAARQHDLDANLVH